MKLPLGIIAAPGAVRFRGSHQSLKQVPLPSSGAKIAAPGGTRVLARIRPKHVAWAAIAAGAVWRAADLMYGLPSAYIPDEEMVVNSALGMAGERSLRPLLLDYPSLYQYLLLVLYGAAFAVMKLFGAVSSASEFGVRFYEDPTVFYLLGRIASAAFGVGAIALAWRVGARLFGAWAGAAAACVLALSPVHQGQSVAAVPNSAMTFAGALALLAIVRVFERGSRRDSLLAGAAIALSVSFKYNTGLLVLSLAAAHLLRHEKRNFNGLLLSLAVIPPLFLLLNPYWILDFRSYLDAFLFQSSHMKTGHPGHLHGPPVLWFAMRTLAEEGIVGAAFLAGLVVSVGRLALSRLPLRPRARSDALLLAYALPSFLAITSLRNQGLDYCIGLYPVFAILAGRALSDGLGALHALARHRAPAVAACVLLLPALVLAGSRIRDAHLSDTRTLAREWVEANIPGGTAIGIDGMIYNPQFLRMDRFEGNAPGGRFLSEDALERARERLEGRRMYRIVPLAGVADEPIWPDETPPEVRERHENEPWPRLLFRRYLYDADELLARGADYFFTSSYTLHGVYHARWYPPDSPVHYLTLREKLGYERLLSDPRVALVRRWEPGSRTRGPVLSLYRLEREPERFSID